VPFELIRSETAGNVEVGVERVESCDERAESLVERVGDGPVAGEQFDARCTPQETVRLIEDPLRSTECVGIDPFRSEDPTCVVDESEDLVG